MKMFNPLRNDKHLHSNQLTNRERLFKLPFFSKDLEIGSQSGLMARGKLSAVASETVVFVP